MPFGREPTKRISVFCRKKLTAKEEMSSVAGIGVAQRPEGDALGQRARAATAARKPPISITASGWPKSARSA